MPRWLCANEGDPLSVSCYPVHSRVEAVSLRHIVNEHIEISLGDEWIADYLCITDRLNLMLQRKAHIRTHFAWFCLWGYEKLVKLWNHVSRSATRSGLAWEYNRLVHKLTHIHTPRNLCNRCMIYKLLMHNRYINVLGTSQVHQDDRFLMKMGLGESTLSSKHRERLKIVWAHRKLWLDEPSSSYGWTNPPRHHCSTRNTTTTSADYFLSISYQDSHAQTLDSSVNRCLRSFWQM